MSGSSTSNVFTIEVGTPGQFTQDANTDIAATLNNELKNAPVGAAINVIFNPGDYGELSTILLPSNTTVTGDDAELNFLPKFDGTSPNGAALISNAATYYVNNNAYLENPNGSYTEVPWTFVNTARVPTTYSAIIFNTNISVSGLIFNETGNPTNGSAYRITDGNTFGTWFSNCTNISVSNNTYIGGNDGNAYVNVTNGLVANNIAIGNLCAFDNWNGTSDVTIINNQVWQKSVGDNSAFAAVQVNSSPNGNPASNGNVTNDSVINNSIAGNTIWQSAVNANPLLDHGFSTESDIVIDGNIDTSLGGYTQGIYSAGPLTNIQIKDNLLTSAVVTSENAGLIVAVGQNSYAQISGNLLVDPTLPDASALLIISNDSTSVTQNNATVLANIYNPAVESAQNLSASELPAAVEESFGVQVPDEVAINGNTQLLTGFSLFDTAPNSSITVTVTSQFGTLSSSTGVAPLNSVTSTSNQLVFTGSVETVNQDLSGLTYNGASSFTDDSVQIVATDSSGDRATASSLILRAPSLPVDSDVVTIASGFITSSDPFESTSGSVSAPPSLLGNILVASYGNNIMNLADSSSIAYLGNGNDTVVGGSLDEYIAAGSGAALASLVGGGNVTFVGGGGTSTVDALTGADLIECSAGALSINGANNNLTVIGGLGSLSYTGYGSTYITTLPQDGGKFTIKLGSGNSTVDAFSGAGVIFTSEGTSNDIALGSGSDCVMSSGSDFIYTGNGSDTINVTGNLDDTIIGGGGNLTIEDNGNSVSFCGGFGVQYVIGDLELPGDVSVNQLADGILTVNTSLSQIDTRNYVSVVDDVGYNLMTIGGSSHVDDIGGNDIFDVVDDSNVFNSSISGINGYNTLNFGVNDGYQGVSNDFVSKNNVLNFNGEGRGVIYAADQDTVNLIGSGNVLTLLADNQLSGTVSIGATSFSNMVNIDGQSTALIETGGNSIYGSNGATVYASGNANTISGQDVSAQVSGYGDQISLTGSDTLISQSPYSYATTSSVVGVQNYLYVEGGQFTVGGCDWLYQKSGTASISLFGGNEVTIAGAGDSVRAADEIYGGDSITNNGQNNTIVLSNSANAVSTINAVASTFVQSTDYNGSSPGFINDNSGEGLTFICGTGTSNTVIGGTSNAAITLFGGQSSGNFVQGGRSGANSLNGAYGGHNYFIAGGNGDVLIGGSQGQNTLVSGLGNETLVGAALGNDAFLINGGGGSDLVEGFSGNLSLAGGLTVSSESNVAGSLILTLSDNTKVIMVGTINLTQNGNFFN